MGIARIERTPGIKHPTRIGDSTGIQYPARVSNTARIADTSGIGNATWVCYPAGIQRAARIVNPSGVARAMTRCRENRRHHGNSGDGNKYGTQERGRMSELHKGQANKRLDVSAD